MLPPPPPGEPGVVAVSSLPHARQSDAPRLILWPHAVVIRWVSSLYNISSAVVGVRDSMNIAFDVLYWYTSSAMRHGSPSFCLGMHVILLLDLCQVSGRCP